MKKFEAWEDQDGVSFSTPENISNLKEKGLLSSKAKLLYVIKADSYEEAMIQHHEKMGWEPYKAISGT